MRVLVWAALGVVFGDIGTSPLYAMSETASSHLMATRGLSEKVTLVFGEFYGRGEVFGWTSLFFWTIVLVVTLKYVVLIMRADNQGEGGMLSILALLMARGAERFTSRGTAAIVTMAVLGAGMILGDGVITPALSIMSAWEGLEVITHRWSPYLPWLSTATLIALFAIQRFGTQRIGVLFAPVMALWFVTLAAIGALNFARNPEILGALDPRHALAYMLRFPGATLYVIGSVDLCITGCEALYADMGHFTRPAVRRAWYWIVWPALALNYLGQGARMLDPTPIVDGNVFYSLVPSAPVFVYPLVVVSWLATVIASQALISGAFSLIHQAIQLDLFPRASVIHTNPEVEGQIYLPAVNWTYLVLCITLVLAFGSAHGLAPAYGLAVTGTMAFTTVLYFLVAVHVWRWNVAAIGALCAGLVLIDVTFFVSNATQFLAGGYITIMLALVTAFTMLTWRKGRAAVAEVLRGSALPIELFLASVRAEAPHRVKGTAVFMTAEGGVPHSIIHYLKHAKTLHENILILTVQTAHVPEVAAAERLVDVVDHGEGVFTGKAVYGFMETPDIPRIYGEVGRHGVRVDPQDVSFFLGREWLVLTGRSAMTLPRKMFFKLLSQNAVAASAYFRLPPGRVIELGIQVEI